MSRRPALRVDLPAVPAIVAGAACWAALMIVLGFPGAARAATPITFDGLAAGTTLSSQLGRDGVVFIGPPQSTGLPVVVDVGTAAGSGSKAASSQCPGCELTEQSIVGRLARTRDTVAMHVGLQGGPGQTLAVTLQALDAAMGVIGTTTVNATTDDVHTLISVDPPGTDDIAYFLVRGSGNFAPVLIDDLAFTDTGTGAPDIAISPGTDLELPLGGALDVPVAVARFNGSSGNVTMSVSGLPEGVTGTFSPAVLGGAQTATTLHLAATADAASATEPVTMTVTGTPADALVAPGSRSGTGRLTVLTPFALSYSASPFVPSCGAGSGTVVVTRRGGFAGAIRLTVDPLPAGYVATLGATTVLTPGAGAQPTPVTLTVAHPSIGGPGTTVTVRGTSPGAPAVAVTLPVYRYAGSVSGFSPGVGDDPQGMRPGDTVTITGAGFCAGGSVRFGNSAGVVTLAAGDIAAGGRAAVVRVPRYATTGPITVVNGDGAFASSTSFSVRSFRAIWGYQFVNPDGGDVTVDDLKAVYGERQTNVTVNLCWPLDCEIVSDVVSPLTLLYQAISNGLLAGNGSCFGVALTSQRLEEGWQPFAPFAPAFSSTSFQLDGPTAPAPALAATIRGWHSAQLSDEMIASWATRAASNVLDGGASTRMLLEADLHAGHHPLVTIRNNAFEGHIVVADDVRPGTGGDAYLVDVSDPNLPYLPAERTDPALRSDRMDRSVIHVRPDGSWTYAGGGFGAWSGGPGAMVPVPWGTIPRTPTMPTSLSGLISLVVPLGASRARTSQVTDERGRRLLGDGGDLNTDSASAIPGAQVLATLTGGRSAPIYALPATGGYTQTLVGTGVGTTGAALLAPGFAAAVEGVRTTSSSTGSVRIVPRTGALVLDSSAGGDVRARLAKATGGGQYGAEVAIQGGDPGRQAFALDPRSGTVTYRSGGGAAIARMRLSWGGKDGAPATVDAGLVAVPRGGSVVIRPANWSSLVRSEQTIVVRDAGGSVVSRRVVRPRPPASRIVALSVAARTVKGRLRAVAVRARFRRVPRDASVQVVVSVLRGRRSVATRVVPLAAARAHGVRTVSVRLALKRGRYEVRGAVVVTSGAVMPVLERRVAGARFRAR